MAETAPGEPGDGNAEGHVRRQLSRQLSRLIGTDEEPNPEAQPLVGQASASGNRVRFERNRIATGEQLWRGSMVLFCVFGLGMIVWVVLSVYFFIRGWLVWADHGRGDCDQPLGMWLLMMLVQPLVGSSFRSSESPRCFRYIGWIAYFVLLVLGLVWISHCQTCQKTNPDLYFFVKDYLVFLFTTWSCCLAVPLAALVLVGIGMHFSAFEESHGADPSLIKKIETVAYDENLFAREGEIDDSKLPSECCICQENFGPDLVIKRTPCNHTFHEECLGDWLRVTTTCPLCRNDLEQAIAYLDAEAGQCPKRE
eukprot:TRINITY_DN27730_c0_g1_i1.p1 TRINITY_DN27730_c0_g1~~TRINITY_DN27730_c0_g1_i1.p1  ORF type:complete len:330 (+),score=32.26 TRINITY_DN27730_c0_g1_i1:62-991(+)